MHRIDVEAGKRSAGRRAAEALVTPDMRLGLGTGSTALHTVARVGERYAAGELPGLLIVATSTQTETLCWSLGLPLVSLNDRRLAGSLDLAIDGADQVDPRFRLIKGGGAAMLREKVVARAAARYAVVVDATKLVTRLGLDKPIPVEVVREAVALVSREAAVLGAHAVLRQRAGMSGPVITDHGNFILDLTFSAPFEVAELERGLKLIPGVLENGIFTNHVHDVFVGTDTNTVEHRKQETT